MCDVIVETVNRLALSGNSAEFRTDVTLNKQLIEMWYFDIDIFDYVKL